MYENISPESIKEEVFAALKTGLDTREGSFVNDMTSALAVELYKAYTGLRAAIPMFYVDETSGEYIDKRAAWYGITRKQGAKARAVVVLTGVEETRVPAGTIFTTAGGLRFALLEEAVLAADGAQPPAEARDVGERYNVGAGAITQQYVSMPGVTGVSSLAAAGGTNPESDASLVGRLYAFLQKPATSGNAHHYEQWAMAVDGVGAARVFPAKNGGGTVTVLVAGPEKQPVDSAVVAACAAHIEENRPVCVGVTVVSAKERPITVRAAVRLESRAAPDGVRDQFADSLREYLLAVALERREIPYNRIAYMLLDIDGVVDYTSLTVNGGTGNIVLEENEVPVLGEVTVE